MQHRTIHHRAIHHRAIHHHQESMMHRYVIERDLPGVGSFTTEQLQDAGQASNAALRDLGPGVQWVQSFITADRIYCVYLAENEQIARDHARLAGLPATKISEVVHVVDPLLGSLQHA
jgi:hypothetical protein